MFISYHDLHHYQNFKSTAPIILNSLKHGIKDGTIFLSHIDETSFSVLYTVHNENAVNLEEGTRLPLEESY